VITRRDDEGAARAAGFDFARQLRHKPFRDALKRMGRKSGQDIIIALDDEPVRDVLDRIIFQARPPAYVAIRRAAEALGFVFLVFVPGRPGVPVEQPNDQVPLAPTTSIGMLYDAVRSWHSLPLNEWLRAEAIDMQAS
jgi:hypothetical protein